MSEVAQMAHRTDAERVSAEQALMQRVQDLAEGKGPKAPEISEFLEDDADRFESRLDETAEARERRAEREAEQEAGTRGDPMNQWGSAPSVRDQIGEHPSTVRMVEPVSLVLDPQDEGDLKKLNDIQRKAADPDSPQVAITDYERKFHDGRWSVFLTYAKIQYQKL